MASKLTSIGASKRSDGIKMIGYGASGAGKTRLIETLPNPLIINIEDKLGCIENDAIPVYNVANAKEAIEAVRWACTSDEAKSFESIAIDSITELADFIYAEEYKKANGDNFGKATKATETAVTEIFKQLKGLRDKHVYMTAKYEELEINGVMQSRPRMITKRLSYDLPHKVDVVFACYKLKEHHVLQCQNKGQYFAADLFGKLDEIERPDLGKLIEKIKGGN